MLGNVHEAEDLTQETLFRAFLHIHSFDEQKKFSAWLYRIATNLLIDQLRKRKPDFHLDAEVKGTSGLNLYSHLASPVLSADDGR